MKNILLIYPQFPDTYWSFKHSLAFIGKRAALPPLGLITVAALLPKDCNLQLVDMNVEKLKDKDIVNSDIIFISAMIVQKDSLLEVISKCNNLKVPVVVGGPYPTSCWEEISGVDYFVLGEVEITLQEFLTDFKNGTPKHIYETKSRPALKNTPTPRYDLLKTKYYNSIPIQFSRGCPFDCEFCDIVNLFGRIPRTKTPEAFSKELDAIRSTKFKGGVFIVDDNFIGNKRKVKELLRSIIDWQTKNKYPFTFSTEASIDLAEDDELLDLMKLAKFTMVFIGLETPIESSLKETNKRQNLKLNVVDSVKKIQSHGIEVTGGFIIGFDSDPPSVFEQQINFIKKLAIPTAMIGLLQALPNTKLSKRLKEERRLLSVSTGNNTNDLSMNFIPKLQIDFLMDQYRKLLKTIYNPQEYFTRCLNFLHRIDSVTYNIKRQITIKNIITIIASLTRQGMSSYRKFYFKFMREAFKCRPKEIERIFTLAIQGHHFFTITNKIS